MYGCQEDIEESPFQERVLNIGANLALEYILQPCKVVAEMGTGVPNTITPGISKWQR